MTALSSDFNFNVEYSADYSAAAAPDGVVVNFDAYQTLAAIDLPLKILDDKLPEKQEALVMYLAKNHHDKITTVDLAIVTIIDNDVNGKW